MAEHAVFEPKWPDQPNGPNGLYYPDDIQERTPQPDVVPHAVIDVISKSKLKKFTIKKDQSFTLFPKLPLELRRLIWRHTLHVNREARGVALELYKARFGLSSAPERPPEIYVNSEIDTIYLGVGNFDPSGLDPAIPFLRLLNSADLESIKHLAIDEEIELLYPDEDEEIVGLMKMGFKSLEPVTIISNLEKKMDVVLQRWKKGRAEFHAWKISKEKALTCQLTKRGTLWEGELSELWAYVEKHEFKESTSINTVRMVSWGVLGRELMWAPRIKFLRANVYVPITGCLYGDDGLVRRLVELEEDEDPKYDELADIINVGLEGPERLDPLDVYVSSHKCVCYIGHRQWIEPPDWVPDISKIDLRGALAIVDGDDSA
ncbi:hypothetical protein NA56DRAFT_692006 [Hyaloscypha hepaticicola]|uniref:Uncharacterized protein n=1 Tax=Hyaloscypha hepaticicola TaxID=2082293 RepID=A0A2J6PTN2_9HELO|nr:hypothetical protein NA56DRAFT_692006 [Hyaloscypha hepaticicola]